MIYSVLVTVHRYHINDGAQRSEMVSRARFTVGSRDDAEIIEHMCSVDRLRRIVGDAELQVRKQVQVRVNHTWVDADSYSLEQMLDDIKRALSDAPKQHSSITKVTDDDC